MTKRLMMMVAVLCCIISVSAQEARNQIYRITLGNVQYAHHNEKMSAGDAVGAIVTGLATGRTSVEATKYEEDVKSAIIKGLSNTYRFRFNNGLLQLDDILVDGNIIVDALITNIHAKSNSHTWKDKNDKVQVSTYYTGEVEVILTLKDAKTGELIDNSTVKGWGSGSSHFTTPDQAIRDAIGRMSGNVTNWFNQYRPLQANIIQGGAAKKDKQKTVFIDLGSNEGAFAGLHMGVYVVKNIAGREAKMLIGRLRVDEVMGSDISSCKIQSGSKEIKAAIDAGEQLMVISN